MTVIGGDQQDVEVNQTAARAQIGLATTDVELIIEASGVGPPGPVGPAGPPGGITGWWDYDPQTVPPVASGHIRTSPDPSVVGQPMTVYLASQDDDGLYWAVDKIKPGDEIRLRGSAGTVQYLTVTSFSETNPGVPAGYATIVGTLTSSTGSIAKNAQVEVALFPQTTMVTSLVLVSPDGKKHQVTVDNAGVLHTAVI